MEVTKVDSTIRNILLIVDKDADRQNCRRLINESGNTESHFLEATSGKAGLETYDDESVDCILLDLHLPDMMGLEFVKRFHERFGENVCPIIMLTRQGSEELAVKVLKAGAHDYLSKNGLTSETLSRSIDNASDKVSLHRRLQKQQIDLKTKNNLLHAMKGQLEQLVEERTTNLIETNERLLIEIEERRKAEAQVRESARFNRMIMDTAPTFIAYVDEDDCYRFANQQYQRIFRCQEEDILGISVSDHLGQVFETERKFALLGKPQDFEHSHVTDEGDQEWYHILLTPHRGAYGELVGYFIVGMDATEKKAADAALMTQAQLIDHSLNAIISTTEDGIIRTWNLGAERIFRLSYEEAIGQHISFIFMPDQQEVFEERILKPLQDEEQMEADLVLLNGENATVQVHALFSLLKDINGKTQGVVGYYLDNSLKLKTERSLKETEAKFSALFRDAATGIIISDLEGKIADCNVAFERILNIEKSEAVGKTIQEFYLPGEDKEEAALMTQCEDGDRTSYQIDRQLKTADGRMIWGRITTSMILGEDDKNHFIVRMLEDITQQKENTEFIEKSLEEKQVLLREIHHRVKNNLQVIQSLLRMQGRESKGSSFEPLLRESQNRIRSIALIHEQLYRQDDFAEIDFADYLNLLLRQVFRTFEMGTTRISSRIEFRDIYLSLTKAIPCALIVNELVTNSIKYAFKGKDAGVISISAEKKDGLLSFTIHDDGCGFCDEMNIDASETLGLKIVRTLTRQIGGTMDICGKEGAKFKLTFEP